MTLGCLKGADRQFYTFGPADAEGAAVLHVEFVNAVLKYSECAAVHVFADVYQPFRRAPDIGLQDMVRPRPECSYETKRCVDLPMVIKRSDYVFATGGVDLQPLAQTRSALGGRFPIAATLSSLDSPFLFPLYCSSLLFGRRYDAMIAPSRAGRETVQHLSDAASEALEKRFGVRIERPYRLVEIPHGVQEEMMEPIDRLAARRILGLGPNDDVILYLGRITPQAKADLSPLLESLAEAGRSGQHAVLVIAGQETDGTYSESLLRQAALMGIRDQIVIIKNFAQFAKPLIYACADLFVSPSDNIQETFGIALIEAMAAGLPVVASDWGGYRDIVVSGETGLLIKSLWCESSASEISTISSLLNPVARRYLLAQTTVIDRKELTAAIVQLLRNPECRARMGENGRRRVRDHFTWRKIIPRYDELWKELSTEAVKDTCSTYDFQDLNASFGHYASAFLTLDSAVRLARTRQEALSGLNGVTSLNSESLDISLRTAFSNSNEPRSVADLHKHSSLSVSAIARALKLGYLELA